MSKKANRPSSKLLSKPPLRTKQDVAKAWVEALRSGEYKQGRSWLYQSDATDEEYCCLGVLCRVLRAPKDKLSQHQFPREDFLSKRIMSKIKLVLEPRVTYDPDSYDILLTTGEGRLCYATNLNDTTDYTFNDIADMIEEKLLS